MGVDEVVVRQVKHNNYLKWLVSGVSDGYDIQKLYITFAKDHKLNDPEDFVVFAARKGFVPTPGETVTDAHEVYIGPGISSNLGKAGNISYTLSAGGTKIEVEFELGGSKGMLYLPCDRLSPVLSPGDTGKIILGGEQKKIISIDNFLAGE